jgi:hypothetical protein
LHAVDSVRVPGRADAVAELSRRLGAARTDSERAECVPPCHDDALMMRRARHLLATAPQ